MSHLRLVFAASIAWIAGAVMLGAAWESAAFAAGACFVVASALSVVGGVDRRRWVSWAILACACLGVVMVATSVRLHSRQSGPLVRAGMDRAVGRLEGVVASDPHLIAGRVVGVARGQDRMILDVSVRSIEVAGRRIAVRGTVIVQANAASWSGLVPSQRIIAAGRFGQPFGGAAASAQLVARGSPIVVRGPSAIQKVATRLRGGLQRAVSGLAPEPRGLLPGLVDGDTSGLSPSLKNDFRQTSLTHLVAVSGTNVTIVLGTLIAIAGAARAGPRARVAIGVLGLVVFVIVARPSPSVLRAAAMGGVALLAMALGRPKTSMPALGAAVVVLLVGDPDLARSVGFALSTLATAGIVVIAPFIGARLPATWPEWLRQALSVPLAAQLACAPVIGSAFGMVGLSSLPANLLVAPLVTPATLAGVGAAVCAQVWLPLARISAGIGGVACQGMLVVAHRLARVPGGTLAIPTGWSGALMAGVISLVCAVLVVLRPTRRALVAALAGCALAGLAVVPEVTTSWPPPHWAFVACDVGQGDALVVRGGASGDVLVDTGPDPAKLRTCLSALGVKRIDHVILTHMHADHVEGLPAVLGRIPVGYVEIGPLREPVDEWQRVQRWASASRVEIRDARFGEKGSAGPAQWEILGPTAVFHGTDSDPNNSSLVLALRSSGVSMLLTGDAEDVAQSALLSQDGPLRADVLKVPHHGSAHQDAGFLDDVGAKITITSVGKDNPYGHPSPITLNRLQSDGAVVMRTDLDGSVAIVASAGKVVAIPSKRRRGTPGAAPRFSGPLNLAGAQVLHQLGIQTHEANWCW